MEVIDLTKPEVRTWQQIAHELASCTDANKLISLADELIEAMDNCPGLLPSRRPLTESV